MGTTKIAQIAKEDLGGLAMCASGGASLAARILFALAAVIAELELDVVE